MPLSKEQIVQLKGFGKLRTTIDRKVGSLVKGRGARAFRSVAEIWMNEAKRRTPVDTGVLRSTGLVEGPAQEGDRMKIRLVFGGPAAPYAASVHEDIHAYHHVGQALYLESVIMEHRGSFAAEFQTMLTEGAGGYAAAFPEEDTQEIFQQGDT